MMVPGYMDEKRRTKYFYLIYLTRSKVRDKFFLKFFYHPVLTASHRMYNNIGIIEGSLFYKKVKKSRAS